MARTASIFTVVRSTALALAIGAAALAIGAAVLAPVAYAAEADQPQQVQVTRSVGSVEGFGGMAGRVGSQTTIVETRQIPAAGSVEGYGGLAGRVGPETTATSGVAQNVR